MRWLGILLATLAAFVAAFAFGYGWRDVSHGSAPKLDSIAAAMGFERELPKEIAPARAFRQTLGAIESQFYGSADRKELTYAAVSGMISALKDPHTMLMEPEIAKRFQEKNHGEYYGIGAELTPPEVIGTRVRRVFKNSPARERGLKANDVITKVNGKDVTAYKDLTAVVADIRGEKGSFVSLTIYRESEKRTLKLDIERRPVLIQDVYGEVIARDGLRLGRLEVRTFQETIISQFDQELAQLEEQGIKGLILDLRGNPGGLLSAAVEMSARFIDDKLITIMKKRDGSTENFVAPSGLADGRTYPVVILVDEGSASAAEIVAGALQDWRRATLVGEHTYGKGSVQNVRPLRDGAQLKITIARYYLPSGRSIQRREGDNGEYISGGVKPDVEVKRSPNTVLGDIKTDNQLAKAADILAAKLK